MTPSPLRHPSRALVITLAVAVILALRFALLDSFPPATADEGGWPYAVRVWVTEGEATFDFHSAPGYHLMLGPAFALFGPTLEVARWTSACFGVVGLLLLFAFARRATGDRRLSVIALLLLATSFEAVLLDRRALIEPIQIAWLMALLYVFSLRTRRAGLLLAAVTMALLVVKANAIVMVGALGLAALLERDDARDDALDPGRSDAPGAPWRSRLARPVALAAGTVAALGVFGALYLWDPVTFMAGWVDNVGLPTRQPAGTLFRIGRFAIHPDQALDSIGRLASAEPFLFAFGIAGAVKAIHERRLLAPAFMVAFGLPWLLLQIWQPSSYFGVLLAPLALLSAWLLTSLPGRWPNTLLVGMIAFNVARLAGGLVMVRPPEAEAVAWLKERRAPDETVVSASYILMQLEPRTVSIPSLGHDYLPTPERLRDQGIDWVMYDATEWAGWIKRKRYPADTATTMLDQCCTKVYSDERGYVIYRTAPPPQTDQPTPR